LLIETIDTTSEPNNLAALFEQYAGKMPNKPIQVELGEWLYMGCFIQESKHPRLVGNYEVFKNDAYETHIGRCYTFREAKKLCEENPCSSNYVKF
jgi:hypothetical protein